MVGIKCYLVLDLWVWLNLVSFYQPLGQKQNAENNFCFTEVFQDEDKTMSNFQLTKSDLHHFLVIYPNCFCCFYLAALGSCYISLRENCSRWRQLGVTSHLFISRACAIKLLEFIFFNSPTLSPILIRQITLFSRFSSLFFVALPWMPPRRRTAYFKQNTLLDCSNNTQIKV